MKKAIRLRLERRNQYDNQGNLIKRKARRKGDAPIYNGNKFTPKDVKNIILSIQRRLNYNKKGKDVDKLVAEKFGCAESTINLIRRGKSRYNDTKIVQTSDYSKPTKRVHKVIEYDVVESVIPTSYIENTQKKYTYTEEQKVKTQSILNMFG